MDKLKIQPHDIVVMAERGSIYSTYNEWIETNAPAYKEEYKTQRYDGYFTGSCDVLSVLCIAPHSKENPIPLYLCRSLLTDKLILVGVADVELEDTPFTPCTKTLRKMLNYEIAQHICDVIARCLYPDAYPEYMDKIESAVNKVLDKYNITPKEDK